MWKANEVDKYIHKYVLGTRYWHLLTQVIRSNDNNNGLGLTKGEL